MEAFAGGVLGILLGMRHACEPDHLAAISTLVADKPDARRGLLLGAFWGLGHTAALFAVAVALTLLQVALPARLADAFELCVAFMLLGLGTRAVARAAREGNAGPRELHAHGDERHTHESARGHVHFGRWTLAGRPLLVGVVHGLAGSGALTALALANLPGTALRLVYIALFGAGSMLGMALLSGVAGWPLARIGRRPWAARTLGCATGFLSMSLGIFWAGPLLGRLFF